MERNIVVLEVIGIAKHAERSIGFSDLFHAAALLAADGHGVETIAFGVFCRSTPQLTPWDGCEEVIAVPTDDVVNRVRRRRLGQGFVAHECLLVCLGKSDLLLTRNIALKHVVVKLGFLA